MDFEFCLFQHVRCCCGQVKNKWVVPKVATASFGASVVLARECGVVIGLDANDVRIGAMRDGKACWA